MRTTAFRRIGAVVGAAAVVTTITTTPTTATAKVGPGTEDRPCFMVRHPWNGAEGPQPTCPDGRFTTAAPEWDDQPQTVPARRISDFMP